MHLGAVAKVRRSLRNEERKFHSQPPSLPPETNENRNPGFSVALLELETFSRRECTSSQPFSMSSVTWAIHDRSLVGPSSNEGFTALSYCVRVCFTPKTQERSRKFSSAVMNSGAERTSSVSSRSSSRPSFDVHASCLIERISQCLRPLCISLVAAGTLAALNGEPDVAWSERTGRQYWWLLPDWGGCR